jgi:hypothetical protein
MERTFDLIMSYFLSNMTVCNKGQVLRDFCTAGVFLVKIPQRIFEFGLSLPVMFEFKIRNIYSVTAFSAWCPKCSRVVCPKSKQSLKYMTMSSAFIAGHDSQLSSVDNRRSSTVHEAL